MQLSANRVEEGKILHVHDQGGFKKCRIRAPHSPKRLGAGKGN